MAGDEQLTDFGYEQVGRHEKSARVREVFDSVAPRYDLMNDLMSLGLHRAWKRIAVARCGHLKGRSVLDLAGGTGDLVRLLAPRVGPEGTVVLSDINGAMLARGRDRLLDAGITVPVTLCQIDAERLPFADGSFDLLTIGFGLRNVTDKMAALREMHRVLRPGGMAMILEFSRPNPLIAPAYDLYSFAVLPALGGAVARDAGSYRYLAESIRRHPDQKTLCQMMMDAGLERCRYINLSGGIVAVHTGYRLQGSGC
ncbi:MAG TPA: bifunctional demethylmenaquinone methyltransferase/2-methoxy-6-polyprenyl-1,4-benzoquinol methylase UbiE [Gammaproteobacteria bacterium]|nr:bifunctional demethylmenaquinone methyltransferase/2-methoxy-6-polyprenyl-1,4-benzoquinol methylase UbiE [Gammaproteobacteria bacterium]MCH77861.1 bifunctional demethylmenaquinone methyltransferase/2-methoxy-6-polyprenyl-1,4-benzoquinol methylase UbiE [Gammaproteobacteria bacterium]